MKCRPYITQVPTGANISNITDIYKRITDIPDDIEYCFLIS